MAIFLYSFQFGFRSSCLTAEFSTAVSDGTVRAYNCFGVPQAVALDKSKATDNDWFPGLLHKLKCFGYFRSCFMTFFFISW